MLKSSGTLPERVGAGAGELAAEAVREEPARVHAQIHRRRQRHERGRVLGAPDVRHPDLHRGPGGGARSGTPGCRRRPRSRRAPASIPDGPMASMSRRPAGAPAMRRGLSG